MSRISDLNVQALLTVALLLAVAFSCLLAGAALDVTQVGLQAPQGVATLRSAGELHVQQYNFLSYVMSCTCWQKRGIAARSCTVHAGMLQLGFFSIGNRRHRVSARLGVSDLENLNDARSFIV
jgi:hypothetical protein